MIKLRANKVNNPQPTLIHKYVLKRTTMKYINKITFVTIFVTCVSLFINQTIICVNRYLARDTSVALELER